MPLVLSAGRLTEMTEVTCNLFLCTWVDAQDLVRMSAPSPSPAVFIVNCTKDLPMLAENENAGIRVAVDDNREGASEDEMLRLLPGAVRAIDDALSRGTKVIVHCLAGRQRSAAVVCAFLMWKHRWSLEESAAFIKGKKMDVFFPEMNFRRALTGFGALLGILHAP